MKVKHTPTHAHTQATRLGAKSKRLSARPSMLLSAIALVCSGSSAFAACDTATITGNCSVLILPSGSGNVDYVVDKDATIVNDGSDHNENQRFYSIKLNQEIKSFTNNGRLTTPGGTGWRSWGYAGFRVDTNGIVSGDITNNGVMDSTAGFDTEGIQIIGAVGGNIVNTGRISIRDWGVAFNVRPNAQIAGSLINTKTGVIEVLRGTQVSSNHALEINADMKSIINEGSIYSQGYWGAAFFGAQLGTFNNSGTISADGGVPTIYMAGAWGGREGSRFDVLVNTGVIRAGGATKLDWNTNPPTPVPATDGAIRLQTGSSIGVIHNLGSIVAPHVPGIDNRGTITTLNNYQGANGSHGSALTYSRFLPTNYNMIAYGDRYGQLSIGDVDASSGTMMFGVFGGDAAYGIAASKLKTGVYQNVVMGATGGDFTNQFDTSDALTVKYGVSGAAFGNYNGLVWMLTDATYRQGDGLSWDLTTLNLGADMAEPQRALLEQRQSAIRTGLDHDCKAFDKDKLCVWLQARRSGLGDAQESAGVVTVAKRINDDVRLGGFVDMPLSGNEVRGVQMKSRSPVLGLFAAYSEGHTGTGLQARAAVAYQDGKADITRGSLFDAATQLTGSAKVVSQGASLRLGWGTELNKQVLATPYVGVRSAKSKRGAYSDGAGAVDPLNFAAYGERRVTSSLGLDFDVNRGQDLSYRLGLGVDRDTTRTLDPFQATSSLLGELSYSNQPMARAKRVFGAAGVNYIIEPNRTLTLDLRASQMDFGNKLGYAMQVGYRMAF